MSDGVLDPFVAEAEAIAAAKLNENARREAAAGAPTIETWTGRDGEPRYTLTRSQPWESADGVTHKAVTVILTPREWSAVTAAVLAQYGLAPVES